jgi:SAM-dependent methyltransferase
LEKDGYSMYRCGSCSLIFVYPQPIQDELNDLYSSKNHYQGNKAKGITKTTPSVKQEKVLGYLSNFATAKIIDIGCSNGEFLIFCRNAGLIPYGIEINSSTARVAESNGLNVFNGTIDEYESKENFDFVYMGDLIEHVKAPDLLIDNVKKIMKQSGRLIIVTPNMDCFWSKATFILYRLFGIPWSCIEPPYHLNQFSVKNLTRLLYNHGLNIENVWYDRAPNLKYELGSLHLIKRYKKSKKVWDLFYCIFAFTLYSLAFMINRIVETFDRKRFSMTIIAKND